MDAHTVLAEIEEMSPFHLARLADCYVGGENSQGARFLAGVRDAVVEAYDWSRKQDGMDHDDAVTYVREDRAHEIADGAVPVYNTDRMEVLTETRSYFEDVSELTGGGEGVLTLAGMALYIVAERLVFALCEEMEPLADGEA